MRRVPTLTWLAARELWITFRLLPLVALPAMAGLLMSVIPAEATELGPVAGAGHWLATGLAVGLTFAGATAAATLAAERERGTLGWLVVRAAPRSSVVIAWFTAFSLPLLCGIGIGATASWLAALERVASPPDAAPFTVATSGVLAIGLMAVATGLAIGSILPPRFSFAVTLLVGAAILGLAAVGPATGALPPVQALAILADLEQGSTPVADAVRSAGLSLVATAVLLVLAAAAIERRDL